MTETSSEFNGSVLVTVPSLHSDVREHGFELLPNSNIDSVVAVTYGCSADAFLRTWRSRVGTIPEYARIINVGQMTRSATTETPTGTNANVVRTVQRPDDLSSVRDSIESALESATGETMLVFDSLTAPLEHCSISEIVSFFARIAEHLDDAGTVGYFYLETRAHDQQTIATLRALANRTVEIGNDGVEWSIRPLGKLPRDEPSLDALFEILRSRRRRETLRYLFQRTEPVDIEEVVTAVAKCERCDDAVTQNEHRRYYTALYQLHLPKLDDARLVEHDASNHRVSICESARWIAPFLSIAEE
ncbi:DUF7504 family protein [Haladaptatus sp. DFWS20]|uniref:DUF7504 family protein n=1 Tax=Haladaptatus sp. DFWS20 TaxID=3403467 RepID=UPI003EBDDBE1